jgi:hypothetical protein
MLLPPLDPPPPPPQAAPLAKNIPPKITSADTRANFKVRRSWAIIPPID